MNENFLKNKLIIIIVITWLIPVFWLIVASFLPRDTIIGTVNFAVNQLNFDNFTLAFSRKNWGSGFINSLMVSSISTILIILISSICAFGISRIAKRNLNFVIWLFSTRMLPPATFLLPFLLIYQLLGLMDTWAGLIIGNLLANLGILIILLKGYFDKLNTTFEEYLKTQGYSEWRSSLTTIISKTKQPVIITSILCFLLCWNEFFFASAFTSAGRSQTLTVIVAGFNTNQYIMWGQMFASCLLLMIPALLAIWLVEKALLKGLTFNLINIRED